MKPAQLAVPLATGLVGIALGLAMAPAIRKPSADDSPQATLTQTRGADAHANGSKSAPAAGTTSPKTRVRTREESSKSMEKRVSIPLSTLAEVMKNGNLQYSSEFDSLEHALPNAVRLLGANERENEEIMKLVKASEAEILSAEQTHLKIMEANAEGIKFDMSGMRGPVEDIISSTKDGIRNTLPADLAETLIESINWDDYYPTKPESFIRLEITRGRKGRLTAWQRFGSSGTGNGIDEAFKDDGTPLPAEEIFDDRWKPYLKGVTILPKDEE